MPTTCLAALIKRLRGIWERYRLRAEAAQNRRDDGHGRASVRIAGSRWRQPRAQGLQTSAKSVLPQTSSGTGHTRLATEKWVMERMQKNNHRQKARMALSAKGMAMK